MGGNLSAREALADVGILAVQALQVAAAEKDGAGTRGTPEWVFFAVVGAEAGDPGLELHAAGTRFFRAVGTAAAPAQRTGGLEVARSTGTPGEELPAVQVLVGWYLAAHDFLPAVLRKLPEAVAASGNGLIVMEHSDREGLRCRWD